MSEETAYQNERIVEVLRQIESDGKNFTNGDVDARQKLISSARELISAAETPVETLLWNIWAMPTRTVALRVAIDLNLFKTACSDNGSPKTNEQLALGAPKGTSPTLVKRITRTIASMRMLDEHSHEQEKGIILYTPNPLTHLLATPEYASGVIFTFDCTQKSYANLPSYLKITNYQNPENGIDGPFQYANDHAGKHAFNWLASQPEVFKAFHGYIHALRIHRPSWTDMYPVQARLVDGLVTDADEGDASALVDMGGGMGQILQDFAKEVPEYKGRLVLQELEEVIGAARAMGVGEDGRIELQVHDFFGPQRVKGARAYFMRSVLHDWSDGQCRQILNNVKDVMRPGYSRILISDCILSDSNPAWQHVSLDIYMMALASAQERTVSEWYKLIESCGLKVSGIYNKGEGNEGLIEVVLE